MSKQVVAEAANQVNFDSLAPGQQHRLRYMVLQAAVHYDGGITDERVVQDVMHKFEAGAACVHQAIRSIHQMDPPVETPAPTQGRRMKRPNADAQPMETESKSSGARYSKDDDDEDDDDEDNDDDDDLQCDGCGQRR